MHALRTHIYHFAFVAVSLVTGLCILSSSSARAQPRLREDDIPVYVEVVKGKDETLQDKIKACDALAKFGPSAKAAIPALIAALDVETGKVVEIPHRAYNSFSEEYKTTYERVDLGISCRIAALKALQAIRPEPDIFLPALQKQVERLPADLARYLSPSAASDDAGAGPHRVMIRMIYNEPALCAEIFRSLGQCGKAAAKRELVDPLISIARGSVRSGKGEGLDSSPEFVFEDRSLRIAAIESLGQIGAQDAQPALHRMATELEPDPEIRAAARKAADLVKGGRAATGSENAGRP